VIPTHQQMHAAYMRQYRANEKAALGFVTDAWHGTVGGYGFRGCRCASCRRANAERSASVRDLRLANGRCLRCDCPVTRHSTCTPCRVIKSARAQVTA
jgi:hypothetical protein